MYKHFHLQLLYMVDKFYFLFEMAACVCTDEQQKCVSISVLLLTSATCSMLGGNLTTNTKLPNFGSVEEYGTFVSALMVRSMD